MLGQIDHIGLAVPDLEKAVASYRANGCEVGECFEMPGLPYRMAYVQTGGTRIELIEPVNPASTAGRFLATHPEGGVYHLAYAVTDLAVARRHLEGMGATVIGDGVPRPETDGTMVLVMDARPCLGTMVELRQPPG